MYYMCVYIYVILYYIMTKFLLFKTRIHVIFCYIKKLT